MVGRPSPRTHRVRRPEKVALGTARAIVQNIVSQGLTPGSPLPAESTMVKQYGVGRASLREALRLLEVQGLVVIKQGAGGGPVVGNADSEYFGRMATLYFQIGRATFADLLEARMALEPMMVKKITEEHDDAVVEQLKALLDPPDQGDDAYETTLDFHDLVATASGNPVLNLLSSAIADIYRERFPVTAFPSNRRRNVTDMHATIIRAMVKGQTRQAEKLMREHMVEIGDDVRERFPGLLDEIVDWR